MSYSTPLDEKPLSPWDAREHLCEIGRWLWQRQFVEANAGNLSYRLQDGRILSTPTMISKGFMKPEDLVLLDSEGNQIDGERKKTSEILVHLMIMKHRPDVRCVIHSHAPHATAFAVTSKALPRCIHPEVEVFLGEVPIAPYQTPGTQAVADTLLPYVQDYNVFLLASHGVVAAGHGILDAFWKTEIIESYCRLLILARALGEPNQLTIDQMQDLMQLKQNMQIPDRRIDALGAPGGGIECELPPPPSQSAKSNDLGAGIVADPDLVRRVTEAVLRRLKP